MKHLTILIFLFIAIQSCDFSVGTAKLDDVKVCNNLDSDQCADNQSIIDKNSSQIYATANLSNATDETAVSISWQFDNQGTWFEIDNVILKANANTQIKSSLSSPDNGWPEGNYKVVFSLNQDNSQPIEILFSIN